MMGKRIARDVTLKRGGNNMASSDDSDSDELGSLRAALANTRGQLRAVTRDVADFQQHLEDVHERLFSLGCRIWLLENPRFKGKGKAQGKGKSQPEDKGKGKSQPEDKGKGKSQPEDKGKGKGQGQDGYPECRQH
jgi:hypothetical protein